MSVAVQFSGLSLARPADQVDLSSATTATRTGPATWVGPQVLEIPFDRALTASETTAVWQLLTAPTDASAAWRAQVEDFLTLTSPTSDQTTSAVKSMARLLLDSLDRM